MTNTDDEPRTLSDCDPGDIVVVDDAGAMRVVYLGALLGPDVHAKGKKRKPPETALVHVVDPETLAILPRSCEPASPTMPVIARVATVDFLRRLRAMNKKGAASVSFTDDRELDPMIKSIKERSSELDIAF